MSSNDIFYTGIGKRKTSTAKVILKEGSGKVLVNDKDFEDFFANLDGEKQFIQNPFSIVDLNDKYDVKVNVNGGGVSSQLSSIRLAIAKAILKIDKDYRPILNQQNLLTRDSRIKERRKYGLKKARKASQYSKR